MSREVWKIAAGWPAYEVSSRGRIRRSEPGPNTRAGKIIAQKKEPNGYMRVGLCLGGYQSSAYVHRIVCEAFHGAAPSPDHQAAHGNGVRHDNRAKNLRWATAEENHADRKRHGTIVNGERINHAKLTADMVREVRSLRDEGIPAVEIAERFGVSKSSVVQIVSRKTWRHV